MKKYQNYGSTYISNHQNWIDNEKYWQEITKKIENDLSDNLHQG